jgi:hypothetical protein
MSCVFSIDSAVFFCTRIPTGLQKRKKKKKLLSSNFVNLVKKTLNNTNDWTFFPLEFQAKLIELQ